MLTGQRIDTRRGEAARLARVVTAQKKPWVRGYRALLLAADVTASLVATGCAYLARPHSHIHSVYIGLRVGYPALAVFSLLAWLAILAASGAYRGRRLGSDGRDYRVPLVSAVRLLAVVIVVSFALREPVSRLMVLVYFPALVAAVVLTRGAANVVLRAARKRGRATALVVLVGAHRALGELADHILSGPRHGVQVVGVCRPGGQGSLTVRGHELPVLGEPDDVAPAAASAMADAVVIASTACFERLSLQQVAWQLEACRIDLLVAPDVASVAGPRIEVASMRGVPLLHLTDRRTERAARLVCDPLHRLAGAGLAILLAPLLLAVAVAVKVGSPGPVLYRQTRVGLKGRRFEMLKFRTMVVDAEERLEGLLALNEHDGALFKIKRDPRVTRVGRFLRRYSLDELPQLFNVVKGDMVLVGPRPCLPREMVHFGEAEHRRFLVKPGMTGLWQVSGRSDLPWADAVKVDLYYVDNWSPVLDASILLRTLRVVAAGGGC
jgi:exopolysaccharide biosynthesis polyprenyl glycosylphosphotransferase